MDWFESLPDSCPPKEAKEPAGDLFYRIMVSEQATESDFLSHRVLYPEKKFKVSECQACSLSVFKDVNECEKILKMPTFKNKQWYIGEFELNNNDGLILNTPSPTNPYHFSWWRSSSFNIVNVKTYKDE